MVWIVDRNARERRDDGLQIFEGLSTRSRSVLSSLKDTGGYGRELSTFEKTLSGPKGPKRTATTILFLTVCRHLPCLALYWHDLLISQQSYEVRTIAQPHFTDKKTTTVTAEYRREHVTESGFKPSATFSTIMLHHRLGQNSKNVIL